MNENKLVVDLDTSRITLASETEEKNHVELEVKELIHMAKRERDRWDFDWGTDLYSKGRYLSMEVALEGMEKLDEPELPVIPQFVADYLEKSKGWNDDANCYEEDNSMSLLSALDLDTFGLDEKVENYLIKDSERFARAWLDDYTIEKEPEWIVKLEKGRYVDNFIENTVGIEIDITSKLDCTAPIRFKDKEKAEAVALLVGGKAEDVPNV